MSGFIPSSSQVSMMRNALGLLYAEKPYRNHYYASKGAPPDKEWAELVRHGLAGRFPIRKGVTKTLAGYYVSLAGHAVIGVEPEQ